MMKSLEERTEEGGELLNRIHKALINKDYKKLYKYYRQYNNLYHHYNHKISEELEEEKK